MKKILLLFIAAFAAIVAALFAFYSFETSTVPVFSQPRSSLRVLAYANFLKAWGPADELAKDFEQKHNVSIDWAEVGNAGMLIENLRGRKAQEMPDVVIGLDLLSLKDARQFFTWMPLQLRDVNFAKELPSRLIYKDFIPFDWSPMTFIFRRGELPAPTHLDDLLKESYANSLALQDPNSSATGMYFLMWILSVKGEEAGFQYLKALKPSIRIISPSWSASYSLFQNNQAPMVFSYFTSSIYHHTKDNDLRYQPVYFDDPHIYSVEYMGVPAQCVNCELAEKFVRHVLSFKSQKAIMEKNYMLPILQGVKQDTPFDFPKSIRLIEPSQYETLLEQKEAILKKWSDLSL